MTSQRSPIDAPLGEHRPDIDGLRGIAVGLVVAYHARFAGVPGGYVGVDIFLVLSGYLVTRMWVPRPGGLSPSYLSFLTRRVRRLFPAMVVMIAATLAASMLILGPRDLASLSASSLAALASAANLYFWGRHSYFASQGPEQPLLHTWSLGLEEQFYLLYPLVLIVLARLGRGLRPLVLLGACVAGWFVPLFLTRDHPGSAFYLLPSRAWEFLLGGVVALAAPWAERRCGWRDVLSVLGLAGIAVAALGFSGETPYPGLAVTLPAVSTACLLWAHAGPPTLGSWLLGRRWLCQAGVMSYSLYLWHWPVLVLTRYALARELDITETLLALAATWVLAWLSWRWVERPFRLGPAGRAGARSMTPVLVLAGVVALASAFCWKAQGLPGRMTEQQLALDPSAALQDSADQRCHHGAPEAVVASQLCHWAGGAADAPGVLVWGDSHANALAPVLAQVGTRRGFQLWQASYSSCPPFVGTRVGLIPAAWSCPAFNQMVLQAVRALGVRRVVLVAYWSTYWPEFPETAVARLFNPYDGPQALRSGSDESNRRVFEQGLRATVDALVAMGVQVWVVRQVPVHTQFVPVMLVQAARRDQDLSTVGVPLAEHRRSLRRVDEVLDGLGPSAHIVDIAPPLCPTQTCLASDGVRPFYVDAHHLSPFGAARLGQMLGRVFD